MSAFERWPARPDQNPVVTGVINGATFGNRDVGAAALSLCLFVNPALAHAQEDDPVRISGEWRARYETLSGQFRAAGSGSDQMLAFRTLVLAEADTGRITWGAELQDARGYLDDNGTPLSTSIVNPVDLLQLYGKTRFHGGFGGEGTTDVQIGRMTLDLGSGRQVERVEFANVIVNYTGAYVRSASARGDELHVFYVVPVGQRPTDFESLRDNNLSGDEEETSRRYWAIHYVRPDLLGEAVQRVSGEAFVYGLLEQDSPSVPTPNRDYLTSGFRISREPVVGKWDLDVEGAYRSGTRRATANPNDVRDLRVRAWTLHASVGRTFDHPWRPRIAVDFDFASGDRRADDGLFDQYERLFGGRRTDLGHTGIHGPLTPANLAAPGGRIEIKPTSRWDARLSYKAAYLASATDTWVVARVRDTSGQSGRFIGHVIDARTRYWLLPDEVRVEVGVSGLVGGDLGNRAPNGSRQGDTVYAYAQVTRAF